MPLADCVCCDPCVLSCNGTGKLPNGPLHVVLTNANPAVGILPFPYSTFFSNPPYYRMPGAYPVAPVAGFPGAWRYDGPPILGSLGSPFEVTRVVISLACRKTLPVVSFGDPPYRFDFFVQGITNNPFSAFNFQSNTGDIGPAPLTTEYFVSCSPPDIRYMMKVRNYNSSNNPFYNDHFYAQVMA